MVKYPSRTAPSKHSSAILRAAAPFIPPLSADVKAKQQRGTARILHGGRSGGNSSAVAVATAAVVMM
jgi:hypothetical protein